MSETAADLWRRWRNARDARAFEALVLPELPRAVLVARGTGCDAGAADDAVQEALAALAVERSDAPLELGLRVWLYRTVRDRARSSLRARRRRTMRERSAARPEARAPERPQVEALEMVERVLGELRAEEREAVRLRCTLDLDYREIARVLGTTEGAARVRVHRALERLRERLGGDAAALLAALPLPLVAGPVAWVKGALVKSAVAGAAGAGAASAGAGGVAMLSTKSLAAAGVVAVAAGVAVVAVSTPREDAPPEVARVVETEAPAPAAAAERPVRRETPVPRPPEPAPGELAFLDDLDPTDEERAWLREALLAERVRRTEAVVRESDTGIDVLRRYLRHGADVEPVLASFDAARRHVRPPEGEPVRFAAPDGEGGADLRSAAGAEVFEFGPGRFDLRGRGDFLTWHRQLGGLTIRGAGMDRTTLVLDRNQEITFRDPSVAALLSDLTLECVTDDTTWFDVRGGASLALERVRVSGWQTRAGHSAVFGISGEGFLACRDSEFLSHGDGDGYVLSLRGPGLAVFENCTFADTYSAFIASGAAGGERMSVVRAIDCTFETTRLADSRLRRGTDTDVVDLRVRGGSARILGAAASEGERQAAWGAEFAASVEDVEFGPASPRFTVADAVAALQATEPAGLYEVLSIRLAPGARNAPPELEFLVRDREVPAGLRAETRRAAGGRLVPATPSSRRDPGARLGSVRSGDLTGTMPLHHAIQRARLPDGAPFRSAGILVDGDRTLVEIEAAGERHRIDARTGERVQ